ncbi:hypothetical protein [Uliginosibacterium gangwonense]|uniref:hypothetical protein n=1 Tax=Uliginosibacterium gangwonense TaxID=392736 RepID=UPI00036F9CEA|nr:hypothetical protein [Uliginosibacterium gangwonense]
MIRKSLQPIMFGALLMSAVVQAKVADPKPVMDHGVEYRSHANYVEARVVKTDRVLWKQVVFEQASADQSTPNLEQDVQWTIINALKLQKGKIRVENNKGQVFFLDKKTGKLLPK